jgi:hypothetical protein
MLPLEFLPMFLPQSSRGLKQNHSNSTPIRISKKPKQFINNLNQLFYPFFSLVERGDVSSFIIYPICYIVSR